VTANSGPTLASLRFAVPPHKGEGEIGVGMKEETVRARAMRKALTPPEARMWSFLKTLRAEGYHFRRQAPFRGYFLDFVCHDRRLVIEVDGMSHEHRFEHDRTRDAVLAREGYRTVRFYNADIRDGFDGVAQTIRNALAVTDPTRSLRDHPPHEGEGE